jgi:transposase
MRYIGIDFHKRTSYLTIVDKSGKLIRQWQIQNSPQEISAFARQLQPGDNVAVEAVGHWMYLYEQLEDSPASFTLSHPQATKAIASARLKNDKVDSAMLAHLLRTDLLPTAYIPPRDTRDLRELLRLRAFMVRERSRIKHRIRSILLKAGKECESSDVLNKKGIRICSEMKLRKSYRLVMDHLLRLGEHFNRELDLLEDELERVAHETPATELLMTMPGIGLYSSLLILSEIGEIKRFRKADHLVSWAGLAPKVDSSSDKIYRGPITKRGSKYIRWILIEISYHAIRNTKRFGQKYKSVKKRRGHNKAKVAVAASMLRSIHWMLTTGEVFKDC